MVRNVKGKGGFSFAELLVAIVMMSIAAMVMISVTKVAAQMGGHASTSDVAHAIARERMALLQNGEMLLRDNHVDTIIRDEVEYVTFDEIDTVDTTNLVRLSITVSWEEEMAKSINMSGYIDREVCPDSGVQAEPDSILLSNNIIPQNTPPNTAVGEITIFDTDSGDMHIRILDDTAKDNELFKIESRVLLTADSVKELGVKTVQVTVEDCAGNIVNKDFDIQVSEYDSVPSVGDQFFSVAENSSASTSVGMVVATPYGVTYAILSQSPVSPFSISTSTGEIFVSFAGALDHETYDTIEVQVQATNMQWHDTGLIKIAVRDTNEPPVAIMISDSIDTVGTPITTAFASIKTIDPDENATHIYTLSGTASSFLSCYNEDTLRIASTLTAGTYPLIVTADDGEYSFTDTFYIAIHDTATGGAGCGGYSMYYDGGTYNGGDEVYYNGYIYRARWWTQETPTPAATNWDLIGACGGVGICADVPAYANGRIYNAPNRVNYGGAIYKTYTYVKNTVPPESPWEKVCDCN